MKFSLFFVGASLAEISPVVDRETAIRIQLLEWQIGIANREAL